MAKTTHIAFISAPVPSHEASTIEFCKRLIRFHQHIHVTCIFPTMDSPTLATNDTLFKSLPSTLNCIFLPVNIKDIPQDILPVLQVHLALSQSMPSFRQVLGSLCSTTPLAALIVDLFAKEALEIAKDFNLLTYVYFPPSATMLCVYLHLPTLHKQVSCEFRDHKEAIQIPGCIPIQGGDLPEHLQHRPSPSYEFILKCCESYALADGFLVNSFPKLEEIAAKALQEYGKPVYLVGPIIRSGLSNNEQPNESECLMWLEKQRPNSVLFLSFGSSGTLSQQQLNELALGLELSGQKFMWVLKTPSDYGNLGYSVGANKSNDPLQFLPDGFLERTKEQGLVVPFWAPQIQILSHTSTCGFVTHCGWNSILESIVMGVPMITWPLHAEQRMNAALLTEDLKVALRPKFNENGIVEREEIAKVIRGLLLGEDGDAIRQRIEKFKDAAAHALKEEDVGSSARALSQFTTEMENLTRKPLE